MKQKNYAAILPSPSAPLTIQPTPFPTTCPPNSLILHNHAVAINPVDWKIQANGSRFNISYPAILGEDVAGVVLAVGSNVSTLRPGDRVIAHATGLGGGKQSPYGGFQLYPTVTAALTAKVPEFIPLESAAVLPLSISTAAAGLYLKSTLSLRYPSLSPSPSPSQAPTSTLLLWGGSSSIGSSVLQLAHSSRYATLTTASPRNYAYCKSLGAGIVLDYHNPDVVAIAVAVLRASGTRVVGAYDAIGNEATVRQCAGILAALGGGAVASVGSAPEDLPEGVEVKRISAGGVLSEEPEVAERVWGEWVPKALEGGGLVPSPREEVVGRGLGAVQRGLEVQREGVSARKVVVGL
ncbi:MAG: hypothetical protein Q9160_008229 [Pyrenula sp. 1 TL-2023]